MYVSAVRHYALLACDPNRITMKHNGKVRCDRLNLSLLGKSNALLH